MGWLKPVHMMTKLKPLLMALSLAAFLLPGERAAADPLRSEPATLTDTLIRQIDWQNGQNDPRNAVREGKVLPLGQVLAKVRERYPGRMLDATLAQEGNRPVYYIKMLMGDGRVVLVKADARNGNILSAS